ncbi:sigma-70 family RNA polymerase sigma factor [Polaribacter sp. HaHaR_3_91]|uniref:sigma-70 family RNA polymerase sigma factor n=1 Tax=Polaribacter sp. HaHaR_3_91 TaxID=2745561 RepID=UPI001C4EC7B8|nr:sigma-70 family RNA polymerase sigma factor [Polaribacter sp. HaHaR_3_91]QXP65178.1 sigma-70 family RNA polymerase sigma factor [Polaribacter sp. HaHaR_3_91]
MEVETEKPKIIFENWVNEYSDTLYSWALYKTSVKEIAEDLVQDTFMSAYHKIDSFKGNSQPKTWLFTILNNKIIDFYRKNAKIKKHEFKISEKEGFQLSDDLFDETNSWKDRKVDPIWDNEEHLLDNENFNGVFANCISGLPKKWNVAITSKYLTGKKTDEICQDLGVTVSNYWQIIHRAKLLLKECLETNWA